MEKNPLEETWFDIFTKKYYAQRIAQKTGQSIAEPIVPTSKMERDLAAWIDSSEHETAEQFINGFNKISRDITARSNQLKMQVVHIKEDKQ